MDDANMPVYSGRYIEDVNNSKFSNSIDLIYPHELGFRDTTDSMNSASNLKV